MTGNTHSSVRWAHVAAVSAAVTMLALSHTSTRTQIGCVPEDFTAVAVNRGETAIFLASSVDIHLEQWSAEAQKDRFARTLLDRGATALLDALRTAEPVGQLRTPNTFPYDLQFAWQEPVEDGGRRVVLIGKGPLVVWKEAMGIGENSDTFTVIEIRLTPDGTGEGKVAIGSNIAVNRSLDLIELKNYDAAPVRLIDVRPRRQTT